MDKDTTLTPLSLIDGKGSEYFYSRGQAEVHEGRL